MSPISAADSQPTEAQISTQFKLASFWLTKGKLERAISGFQEVLQLQPTHQQAAIFLEHALQQQQHEIRVLQRENSLAATSDSTKFTSGKISLVHQKVFGAHRCGWSYAIQALKPLHNPAGILFDGYLENSFLWKHYQPGQAKPPYTQPWVGFLHNPPSMPHWFFFQDSPQSLMKTAEWQQSLENCVGLFCLSNYHAQWVREQTGKLVSALIHPTEIPEQQFDFDRFVENSQKKIVQLGWWLRQPTAIQRLPVGVDNKLGYEKIKLNPTFSLNSALQLKALADAEIALEHVTLDPDFASNTRELSHLSDADYDQLLCENVGFVALYDTSANNTVVECIARATPLLVNPLPAVVEYLGEGYPLYFQTLAEAAEKVQDLQRVKAAHEYLKTCDTRRRLSAAYFCESLRTSEVYQQIVL